MSIYASLSIQSGDTMILKRMGRKSSQEEIIERIKLIKKARPQVVLGADLIVGFPTESDAAFQNSYNLVKEAQLVFLHIFRYSDRPGTPAAAIPGSFRVSGVVAKQRSEILRQAGLENLSMVASSRLGQTDQVLIESVVDGVAMGKTSSFLPVSFMVSGVEKAGEIQTIKLVDFDSINGCLVGVVKDLSTAYSTESVDKM